MKIFAVTTLFFLATHSLIVQAQENSTEDKVSQVEISSNKDPELRSYSQMLKGLKVYTEKHQLAPNSELYFILTPKSNSVSMQDLNMRLASDNTSINIPIDSTGMFKLPFIELKTENEYDLILNKAKGLFRITPYVKSANLPEDVKRLGDLRMECEVRWAISKQDVSVIFLTYVKLLGSGNPCTSRAVAVGLITPKGVNSITLDTPKSKFLFKVHSYETYSFPLWDTELNDDGQIKYGRSDVTQKSSF